MDRGEGSRFSVSNLRNAPVVCRCRLFVAISLSHVDYKKCPYHLTLCFYTSCHMLQGSICMCMHVPSRFKKKSLFLGSTPIILRKIDLGILYTDRQGIGARPDALTDFLIIMLLSILLWPLYNMTSKR